ncbi:TonB-dependent receptor [bacterium]|nr:TonB-dependent receptor [bacterium]
MKRALVFSIFWLGALVAMAQNGQTVRGKIIDADTKMPLYRARVFLVSDSMAKGMVTDSTGNFAFKDVPTGRHTIKVMHRGHKTKVLTNVVVLSGKETVLNLSLQVAAFSDEEETDTKTHTGEVGNEMAMVSAREFSVDETVRYAGSRGDPIRTALNFAGVQGLDDSRNDLVIRGNSPYGLAIQIDGVNIMNSNHFATPGTNGGPLSKISFKCLDNSDFYSGSMPAEFGNCSSGVFDLRLKTGNNQKHEQGIYFGVLGTDVFAEGPINREKGSSYIFNYRRSVINLFMNAGLDFGTNAVPFYQDLNFKLNYPKKNGAELSFWGITGNSRSSITLSDDTKAVPELYGDNDRDQYSESGLDILGLTYTRPLNTKTFLKATIAYSKGFNFGHDNYIVSRDTLADGSFNPKGVKTTPFVGYNYRKDKYTLTSYMNRRLAANKLLKVGFTAEAFDMRYYDSVRVTTSPDWVTQNQWTTRWNSTEVQSLWQYFAQYKQEFGQKFQATLGLHGTYFTLGNGKSLIEPRMGFSYNFAAGKTLSFGAGLYSQTQPPYMYYYLGQNADNNNPVAYNKGMGLTKNWQSSLGYNWSITPNLNLHAETYYQYLYNIPVEVQPSAFSLINTGTGFSRVFANPLKNSGTAYNYGLELSLQRYFSKGYSLLLNGTLYQSKYKGSDGVLRNTNFNGNYMANALGTREFKVREHATFGIGTNVTYCGGRRYGNFDLQKSTQQKDVVWQNSGYNQHKYKDYFRLDLRLTYTINLEKTTHEIAFDLLNILNTKNVLSYAWAPGLNANSNFALRQQIGFLPLFYYKLDF